MNQAIPDVEKSEIHPQDVVVMVPEPTYSTTNSVLIKSKDTDIPQEDATDYSAKAQNKTKFSDYLRIFTYSTTIERVCLSVAVVGQIGAGVTLPLMNVVFGHVVGNFADYFVPGGGVTRKQFESTLNTLTLYVVYLAIAKWILGYYSLFVFRMVGLRISAKLRLRYLEALFSLPVSVLDTLPSGQASNTITNTSNVLQQGISDKAGIFVQATSLSVASVIIAFKFSWKLTLVTSSAIVFICLVYGVMLPIIIKMTKEVEFADQKASSVAGEVLGSIRMIVACGAEGRIARRYSGWVEESRRRGLKISKYIGGQYAPMFFSVLASMALCFWFGFKLYREGHIDSVATVVIVFMSILLVAISIGQTAAPIIAASKAASAAADFFAIIDTPKPSRHGMRDSEIPLQEDIHFESVDFAYPGRAHVKILDKLSVSFEAGKITAIVGASGSGKSTIVALLERWYDLEDQQITLPEFVIKPRRKSKTEDKEAQSEVTEDPGEPVTLSGSISIGDYNIKELDPKWWRSQIGLVQQDPFIFNDTIANNVGYGLIGSRWEKEDPQVKRDLVIQACKEAFADEYIDKLPLGYETQVGDAGIKLSGGQRQRLAIARSIIKRPKILILDEATSSIDVRGEKLVQAALDKVSEGRTTITIAHRLSTIKKANKIVVMKKGRIVEMGTHENLLVKTKGAYAALVNAQQLSMDDLSLESTEFVRDEQSINTEQLLIAGDEQESDSTLLTVYEAKSLPRSFGLLLYEQKKLWPWYLVLLVACMGAGLSFPVQAYLFANIMLAVSSIEQQVDANHWAFLFFVLALGIGVAYFLLGWSSNAISVHVSCHYRQEYFENILAKPIPFFDADENSSGTLTARVANDPTQLQQLLGINMSMVLTAIFGIIGCIIVAFAFGWKLTLVALLVAMPLVMGGTYLRVRYELQFERMNQEVFAESSKFAAESIGAFRTVTSLTLEDMICRRYDVSLANHVKKAFMKARYSTAIFSASDSVPLLSMALIIWYGGRLLASHEYGPAAFFVVYIAIMQGAENAGSFLSLGPNMAQATAAANRIISFRAKARSTLSAASELQDAEGGVKIELKDLWFKYPTRDIPIFTGLSLTIEKGQFAALVGPSGCGKTSIVSLLEKFYEAQKGQILMNGTKITDLDTQEYRKFISLVAQEPTLFQGSIKQNVLLGVSESTSEEKLHQACRDAEIHDFITSLPDGYNTDVGLKGVSLSGGQKQRIGIARALIREPKLILLDEATSSLDSESERLVQAAFERAAPGRTMVVVAHRLATIQNADVIFVLGEGKLLEQGNHNSLLRKKGVYYSMCQSQALDR